MIIHVAVVILGCPDKPGHDGYWAGKLQTELL